MLHDKLVIRSQSPSVQTQKAIDNIITFIKGGFVAGMYCCLCFSRRSLGATLFVHPGNIETNHNLPPSYKSRNSLLR